MNPLGTKKSSCQSELQSEKTILNLHQEQDLASSKGPIKTIGVRLDLDIHISEQVDPISTQPVVDVAYSPKHPEEEKATSIPEATRNNIGRFCLSEEEKKRIREKIEREKRKTLSNNPEDILQGWKAMEVLNPQAFRLPEKNLLASLSNSKLPWEEGSEKPRPKQRLFYEIILGTIELEKAVAALLDIYADNRIERPLVKGKGLLATVVVDDKGLLVGENPLAISSFGWAVPKALKGDLSTLAEWTKVEQNLINALKKNLFCYDKDGKRLPLDRAILNTTYRELLCQLELPCDWVNPPSYAIRIYENAKNSDPPEPSLLNSFFLNDLSTAQNLFENHGATNNLRTYLGLNKPKKRLDILNNQTILEAVISPEMTPLARWPGPGRHSLVLLQQAAVNLAATELRETGILSVNGPPGTGKTTLLRDVLAAIITERAQVMSSFTDPLQAFESVPHVLQVGQGWLQFFKLSEKLKGYEVLVTSSNNKAVENISAELPGISAIAADATNLRYFPSLATAMLDKESWGLIAAALGNATNRRKFRQLFWWDNDVGLSTYLAEASGTPQFIEVKDEQTGKVIEKRRPRIVVECDAPQSHAQALKRWNSAKKEFHAAVLNSQQAIKELSKIRKTIAGVSVLAEQEQSALSALDLAQDNKNSAQDRFNALEKTVDDAEQALEAAQELCARYKLSRPSFFSRLTRRAQYAIWKHKLEDLYHKLKLSRQKRKQSQAWLQEASGQLKHAIEQMQDKQARYNAAAAAHVHLMNTIKEEKVKWASQFIDEAFFAQSHSDKHIATPWFDKNTQRLRDHVFVSAIKLHKAFIDAAARPLRHNLGLLMQIFSGRTMPDVEKQALIGDLWSSLFLVIPSVSTTFASVERMFGKLPPESLGWLFIDEAGQALPQAAVGAIMRTKRALVVGDPIQIEPVVTLPSTLTQHVCRHFGVDPNRYNAPEASAQTIADNVSPYYTEFDGKFGSRSVGVPLLVHRRCADPMFSVSNTVAYESLMVHAKHAGLSSIRDCLGPSRWIDIQALSDEKWSPEEGNAVLELLMLLKKNNVTPDLYIVTPFVLIQNTMRLILRESNILQNWVTDPLAWIMERVGTIHTVQGREAEAVIFILGASSPSQGGTRAWAGGRPNLINVAVTRAKEVLYVVGNRSLWENAGLFRELADRIL